jgi:CRISPR-associated endonuclease/helicase Cas3
MMVTFVCECEKKALDRTRRVLDAFANRIGSRTWQTVITEDGLDAVKKLLRKTASKNTAVSCHWIRSRSRSDLVWVVGNKDSFNSQGIVPVNYTNKELIMDQIAVKTESIIANTKQQPLDQHLFAVGYLAYCLIKRVVDDEKLAKAVYVGGCLHDIGKIDPQFQSWLVGKLKKKIQPEIPKEGQHIDTGKFSFETHPRHNEISLLLYHLLNDESFKKINERNKDRIKHTLYWHHEKPIRKSEFKTMEMIYKKLHNNIGAIEFSNLVQAVGQIIKAINGLASDYCPDSVLVIEGITKKTDEDKIYKLSKENLPKYKDYSPDDAVSDYLVKVRENASNNLARTAVITADRLVSALSKEQLSIHLKEQTLEKLLDEKLNTESNLSSQIQKCLTAFEQSPNADSNRNLQQTIAAEKLAETNGDNSNVKVLQGPAGCGKTKIALEWAAKTQAQKILWICPRVQVCQGLLADLKSKTYLLNSKIEIYTGEFKYLYQAGEKLPESAQEKKDKRETPDNEIFTGDIVITTIDQITNAIITHKQVASLVDYMNVHVVFDEYHEYINMPAFNLLFAELVECKTMQKQQAKAILVSATPNYYFVNDFLGIHQDDIVAVPSFNSSQYQVRFENFDESKQDDSNPLYQQQPKNTFVISNTAITAQKSFITHQQHENALLLHSKFKKSDKEALFQKTLHSFGQHGSKEYELLRSGPIVQAALNITCMKMVTEFTHAENWLQRLGRLDRFSENKDINNYITAIPETLANAKQQGSCARFLNSLNTLQSAKKWYEFLQDKLTDKPLTISEFYQLYQDFYNVKTCRDAVEQDFIKALKKSAEVIENKLIDPVFLPRKSTPEQVKIKKHSLRGDNRFVQMAVCVIKDNDNLSFPEQYAYDEADYDGELTAPVEDICGYGNAAQNLLAFMVQKHHNIKDNTKKAYKDSVLLNEARSPETPIYLSYVPNDLKKVEAQPYSYAIYYAQGSQQPIGAISINKLKQQGE